MERGIPPVALRDFQLPRLGSAQEPLGAETMFPDVRTYIRHHGGQYRDAVGQPDNGEGARAFLREAIFTISGQDAAGWFRHCGYGVAIEESESD